MRGFTKLVSRLLMLAALVVVLVMAISGHDADYGSVNIAQRGGTVTLPKGTVKLFLDDTAVASEGAVRRLAAPLAVQVVPAAGGSALPLHRTTPGAEGDVNERSSELGANGSVAELDVPAAGDYRVAVSAPVGTIGAITFGADRFTAILREWRLWCGLFVLGVLVALLPVPRRRRPSISEPSPA